MTIQEIARSTFQDKKVNICDLETKFFSINGWFCTLKARANFHRVTISGEAETTYVQQAYRKVSTVCEYFRRSAEVVISRMRAVFPHSLASHRRQYEKIR
jgi:serine kinase of HPr protein (carbohydrate metabolism regulator)